MPATEKAIKPDEIKCRVESCARTFTNSISEVRHHSLVHGHNAPWRRKQGLECPIAGCDIRFTRRCGMHHHLREDHRIDPKGKLPSNSEFTAVKKRKNTSNTLVKVTEVPVVEVSAPSELLRAFVNNISHRLTMKAEVYMEVRNLIQHELGSFERT